jgi:hypothetical protein
MVRVVVSAALALASGVAVVPASAAIAQPTFEESIRTAKGLILHGQTAEARQLLQDLAGRRGRSNDVDFLLGLLAVDSRDYDLAIRHFRTMLVRDPNAVRVRLELARAFYLKRDYENAFRQFQFARAGRLPPGVAATIERFLAVIRKEKSWSYNLSVALAPDTNINNGTSAQEVLLFGLPFELTGDARRRSGIGASIEAGAEFAPRISDNIRLRVGGALQRREYRGKDFDDTTVALYAGPRAVIGKWDLAAAGTAFQRRRGGSRLSQGFGAKVDGTYHMDSRTAVSLTLSAQQIRYPHFPLQSGPAYSAWAGVIRALTPSSAVNARIGVVRKAAQVPELASWSQSISVGYYRDLRGGFSIYGEPGFTRSNYDAADPFFAKRRKDGLIELRLAVLNRRIVMERFTPRIAVVWTSRNSSIDLYDLSQRRLEVGVTSTF